MDAKVVINGYFRTTPLHLKDKTCSRDTGGGGSLVLDYLLIIHIRIIAHQSRALEAGINVEIGVSGVGVAAYEVNLEGCC